MTTVNRIASALVATVLGLPALADLPRHPLAKARAPGAQAAPASPQTLQNAARAADAGHEALHGRSLADFVVAHQRWMLSTPFGINSANLTESGANCGVNQEGPAWFLLGPGGLPNFSVQCDVPYGRPIFMPALGITWQHGCPAPWPQLPPGQSVEAFLRGLTSEFVDGIAQISMTLDGRPLRLRRAATGVFAFTAAQDWIAVDPCNTGSPQVALADGYWVLIDPPAPGRHTINLKVTHPWIGSVDGTWTINVKR